MQASFTGENRPLLDDGRNFFPFEADAGLEQPMRLDCFGPEAFLDCGMDDDERMGLLDFPSRMSFTTEVDAEGGCVLPPALHMRDAHHYAATLPAKQEVSMPAQDDDENHSNFLALPPRSSGASGAPMSSMMSDGSALHPRTYPGASSSSSSSSPITAPIPMRSSSDDEGDFSMSPGKSGNHHRKRSDSGDEEFIPGPRDDDGAHSPPLKSRRRVSQNSRSGLHLYKRKKTVVTTREGEGPLPSTAMDAQRLSAMFHRYLATYTDTMSRRGARFSGLTEFVFAVLYDLNAEHQPVSLAQIYAHAQAMWDRLPEELSRRFQTRDFKGSIRSALYACQIFVRPTNAKNEKSWQMRGRMVPHV